MFSSFRRFCSAEIKRATPFLACAAVGYAVSLSSAAPAVAQTGPTTTEARYVTASVRVSPVYNAGGLTQKSDIDLLDSTGHYNKDPYGVTMECWTGRITTISSFVGSTSSYVKNDTSNTITLSVPPYPHTNIFATGSISVATQLDTHQAKSTVSLGGSSAHGEANYPNGDVDYAEYDTRIFVQVTYQPSDHEDYSGSCDGSAKSTFFIIDN